MEYFSVVASIPSLRMAIRPHAVIGRITLGVVHSFNGQMVFWTLTHVLQKVLEFKPPITNSDAFVRVILLSGDAYSATSHTPPHPIRRGASHLMGNGPLVAITPTTGCDAFFPNLTEVNRGDVPAITLTLDPSHNSLRTLVGLRFPQNHQIAIAFSSVILRFDPLFLLFHGANKKPVQ